MVGPLASSRSGIRIALIRVCTPHDANGRKSCGRCARNFCTWFRKKQPRTDLKRYGPRSGYWDSAISGTQEKNPASWHFVRFLVTELHSKEGEAPKRGLWVVRSTGPPSSPGRLFSRSMTGGGPVDTAVTSPCPLLTLFIPKAHGFPRTHMGAVTSNGYKSKTAGS